MTWLHFALLTALFYGIFDIFVKQASDKLHGGTAAFIANVVAAVVALIYIFYAQSRGEPVWDIKPGGWTYILLAGVAVGLVSITFIKVFSAGANLSIGIPVVRVGAVIIASLFGVLFLKEGISTQYLLGAVLSMIGLYLLVS